MTTRTLDLYSAYVKKQPETLQTVEEEIDSLAPINWAEVIANINGSGHSTRKIAETIGVGYSTVQGWEEGSVPNYEAGRKLLLMHQRLTGRRAIC